LEGNVAEPDFITVAGVTYQRVELEKLEAERQDLHPSAVVREVAELEGLGFVRN